MTQTNNNTLNLLKEFKHKRFTSELNPNHDHPVSFHLPLINHNTSSAYGFVCPYHPTQFVTNICLTQQQSAKPLCPRCLQQHMKSHSQSPNPTPCRLQTCETQIQVICSSLSKKLSSCEKIREKICNISKWQQTELSEIKHNLHQFKASLMYQLQKQFSILEKQLQTKWQTHIKQYNDTVNRLTENIIYLEEHCQSSFHFIEQNKQIDHILSSFPEIQNKFDNLSKMEQKMLNSAAFIMEVKPNNIKINQIPNYVRTSLQIKLNKITAFEFDSILKQQSQKTKTLQDNQTNPNFTKLLKLFQPKSSGKLYTLSQSQTKKDTHSPFSSNPPLKQKPTQNPGPKVLSKLNDTTNRLKSSLNNLDKSSKAKVYA